jgi:hypothetical protein
MPPQGTHSPTSFTPLVCAGPDPDRGDYAAGDVCATPKFIAQRLSIESLDNLLCEIMNLEKQKFWSQITHIMWEGLYIGSDGCIVDFTASELGSPSSYTPIVKKIVATWGPKMVWSMPLYADDFRTLNTVRTKSKLFWESLDTLVHFNEIKCLEIDLHVLYVALADEWAWGKLADMNVELYLTVTNAVVLPEDLAAFLFRLRSNGTLTFIVRSFGFQNTRDIRTSHGVYRTLLIGSDSALSHFKKRYQELASKFPYPRQIFMELDTSGIEYTRSRGHRETADRFRLVSMRDIRHRKLFGRESYTSSFSESTGSSTLEFPANHSVISYDNAQVRKLKFDFIVEEDLYGAVLGELQNDLSPWHPLSLLSEAKGRLCGSPPN